MEDKCNPRVGDKFICTECGMAIIVYENCNCQADELKPVLKCCGMDMASKPACDE